MSLGGEEQAALRAMAHPVRLRIMSLLTAAPMTAAEVARELGLTHANASYHLRHLLAAGMIVLAGEEKIRGGVAKRYRHPWDKHELTGAGDTKKRASAEEREMYMRALAEELVRRSRLRAPRSRQWTTDAEMWVSPDAWKRVVSLVEEASTIVHAEARPPRTEGTVHVNMTAVLFEMSTPERGEHE